MLIQVPLVELSRVDLVEQAVLEIPVSYFAEEKGITFESDCDDLDWYDGAFFTLKEGIPFALIHYRGNPENHTSIYLDRQLRGAQLRRTLKDILRSFDLPQSSLSWVQENS
jgi:hypothetical protein